MQILESLLAFLNREYISYSTQYIFRKYSREYLYTLIAPGAANPGGWGGGGGGRAGGPWPPTFLLSEI